MGRVVNQDELLEIRERARREKKRFVFTNGCFDLLHPGHIACLEAARKAGDLLAVGLNSDRSVRNLKGDRRPILGERDRAYILTALAAVDYVCLFDEDTPSELIRRLVPDVLVKGGEYQTQEIVGRDVVEASGGRVIVVKQVPGYATRNLVSMVLERYGGTDPGRKDASGPA